MATTKTLTPTNQAITLAAFTEKPDNRTNVTNDDKLADAVNALNSKNSWKQLIAATITANTAYDQTLSHEDITNYNEIMFVIMRSSNGRTFASSVAPIGLFSSAGLYAFGSFKLYSGPISSNSNIMVSGVAIYGSNTTTEIAISEMPEDVIVRIYVR